MAAPALKAGLVASREEKDGAVYMRLADPTSGREYRLYEVEYRIAQMLDGRTPIDTIAERVQGELKFELSANDLERFVRELEALGFLVGAAPMVSSSQSEPLTADDIIEDAEEADRAVVEDELTRLVRSALLHIKQAMVGQARDYFLAAKKYAPSNEKVGTMLNHFDVVGEDDGPNDIEYLWKQAVVLFPELTQEIGPPGGGIAPIPVEESSGREAKGRQNNRKLIAGLAFVAVVAIGFFGWTHFGAELFLDPIVVEIDKVRAQKVHLFYQSNAVELAPKAAWSLSFARPGVATETFVKVGDVVKANQLVARLRLPPAQEKALAVARQKRQLAEKAMLALGLEVDKARADSEAAQKLAASARAEVDAAKKTKAADKAARRKLLAAANKKVTAAKKEATAQKKKAAELQKSLVKLRKAFDEAKSGEDKLIAVDPTAFLRVPATVTSAVVKSIDVAANAAAAGVKIEPGQTIVTLADTSGVRVAFELSDERMKGLAEQAPLRMFSQDATLEEGKVVEVSATALVAEFPDPEGWLSKRDRKVLRLVRETVDNAFVVSANAKIGDAFAYVVGSDGYAVRRQVEWIELRGREAVARAGLVAGETLVTGPQAALEAMLGDKVKVSRAAVAEAPQ